MRLYYTLNTIDPVIVSENNSTQNNDSCLDYIPGSAILGALAAKHYSSLTDEQSWQAFHSGETLFSHSYPLVAQQLALPTPASWHFQKGKDAIDGSGQYDAAQLSNHAAPNFDRNNYEATVQFKQCREGYLTADGKAASVKQGLTTKTAIDSQTGGAKESQLFSYAYIQPGQSFLGWIDCPNELAEAFKTTLTQNMRIGRSRNSEFGRVEINLIDSPKLTTPVNDKETLVIWCLSDCECLNELGQPTLTPALSSLHPQLSGKLDKAKSFIRSTRSSRFNQKRAGLDSEQILISKGSVLVYQIKGQAEQQAINKLNKKGIGINKQQGLGWVQINPAWAFSANLSVDSSLFNGITIEKPEAQAPISIVDSPLLNWVTEKLDNEKQTDEQQKQVETLLKDIVLAYRSARRYNNIRINNEAGPSSTQWRRIGDIIRQSEKEWAAPVFYGEHAVCKADNDEFGWGINWSENGKTISFADFTKALLSSQDVRLMRLLLEKIGRYDLSTFKGLQTICRELHIDLTSPTMGENHD